jgi:hypothetical protein
MASNYPAGVTDAMIDELLGYDEPELTDEELDAMYLDRLEQEAAALPPAEFPECAYTSALEVGLIAAAHKGSPSALALLTSAERAIALSICYGLADELPRIAPIIVAVRMPAELEAA